MTILIEENNEELDKIVDRNREQGDWGDTLPPNPWLTSLASGLTEYKDRGKTWIADNLQVKRR